MWTILSLLKEAERFLKESEIPSPRLEAEILLAHALSLDRVGLYAHYSRPLEKGELDRFRSLVKRRIRGEPSAYLTEKKEFFSLSFHVSPAVLIPRPETEEVVQMALDHIPDPGEERLAADLGTGSGCIVISLLRMRGGLRAEAVDQSCEALAVAKGNAARLGVEDRVRFLNGNLLQPWLEIDPVPRFDLITCNPPYVDPEGKTPVDPEVAFEPREAVFTPPGDPFCYYGRILEAAPCLLKPEGLLIFELGAGMAPEVSKRAREAGWRVIEVRQDLAGWERVMGLMHAG